MERTTSSRSLGALIAVTLAGCMFPGTVKDMDPRPTYAAPLFEDYVGFIKARSTDEPAYREDIPTIPPSLEATAPLQLDNPFGMKLALASLDRTKICFVFTSKGDRSSKSADDIAKEQLEQLQGYSLSIRALSSLAPEKGKPLWPTPTNATNVDSFTVLSDEVKEFDNRERGTVERRREVTFHVCGRAPEITNATKFIAITAHFPAAGAPDYKKFGSAVDDADRRNIERDNQEERFKADGLILIAITDGAVDLSL